jgi:hypothetical protein
MWGMVARPTEDVDLFAATDGAAAAAPFRQRCAPPASRSRRRESSAELADLFYGFDMDMREFHVRRDDHSLSLTLGRLDRQHSPVMMDISPTLHPDDPGGLQGRGPDQPPRGS